MTADPLVEAVHRRRLPEAAAAIAADALADRAERDRAAQALAACERIGRAVDRERELLLALLHADGIRAESPDASGPRQDRTMRLRIAGGAAAADRAVRLLEQEGFERWERWRRGALESFRRTGDRTTLARTDEVTTVVGLRWGERPRGLRGAVRPTAREWALVDLPRSMWWVYSLVRPAVLVADRVGLRVTDESDLGPFLATPDALLDPLLDLAGVRADDVVVDVGCGDGRLVVRAAARSGCRAVGVERSAALVERARSRARAAGVAELVRIERADARRTRLEDATVVFLFLPVGAVARLLPDVLRRLSPGGRVIVHELDRLPGSVRPVPTDSRVVIGADAVTVAHRWAVDATAER